MYKSLGLFFLGLLLASATPAAANTVTLTLENENPGYSNNGYYVYPYNFSINGSSTLTSLACDDFTDEITNGETWTATVSTFSNLSQTMYYNSLNPTASTTLYEEAAYLFGQMASNPSSSTDVANNDAIWGLFDPSLSLTPQEAGLETAAANAIGTLPSSYFNQFLIYTPTTLGSGQPQELIGYAYAPEPTSLALLGSGLLGLAGVARRRFLS